MIYPDTSFLCSLYRKQCFTPAAIGFMEAHSSISLAVTSLTLLEFRQSVRVQGFLHGNDRSRGFSTRQGEMMLRLLQSDLSSGLLKLVAPDWAQVHSRTESLSERFAGRTGNRMADLMHIASALTLGAETFLSFDERQQALASELGLGLGGLGEQKSEL